MKKYLFGMALALAVPLFTGCANEQQSASSSSPATDPTKKTYSRKDLNNSGRQTTGEAVQALDPAAQVNQR